MSTGPEAVFSGGPRRATGAGGDFSFRLELGPSRSGHSPPFEMFESTFCDREMKCQVKGLCHLTAESSKGVSLMGGGCCWGKCHVRLLCRCRPRGVAHLPGWQHRPIKFPGMIWWAVVWERSRAPADYLLSNARCCGSGCVCGGGGQRLLSPHCAHPLSTNPRKSASWLQDKRWKERRFKREKKILGIFDLFLNR